MGKQQLRLFSNFYLPFCIGDIEGHGMSIHKRNYTREELEHISGVANHQFVKSLEKKGVQTLENNDRVETSVSQCRIKDELVTRKSIVKTQLITGYMEESNGEPEETG